MISIIILIVGSAHINIQADCVGNIYIITQTVCVFAVPRVLLPVRGQCVGGEEGVCRRLHASLLCLLPPGEEAGPLASLHQPAEGPEQVGQNGRLPSLGPLHLHLCRPRHHCLATQRERRDRHYRHRAARHQDDQD